MNAKIVTHKDRTEWLKWRHGGIGSSDASIIMGVSRFKTRDELVLEKASDIVAEDKSNSYIKDRGNKIEIAVRNYMNHNNIPYVPLSCEHGDCSYLRASLDGYDGTKIIEIKLLSSVRADKPNKKAAGYIKWEKCREGFIPEEYYPQVQHQLLVTGLEECVFVGYKEVKGDYVVDKSKLGTVRVQRNDKYINELTHKEFDFWKEVQEMKEQLVYKGELE